jgi:rubrerythrin
MPEFVNPFVGIIPKKMNKRELTRALRLSLAAEEEAIHLYEALADATENKLAKTVLQDIANEEKVHVGEFQTLLYLLLEDEEKFLAEGAEEVNEMDKQKG